MLALITNPSPQQETFAELLRAGGAEVLSLPLHEYGVPSGGEALISEALRAVAPGEWICLTSPRAAAAVGAVAGRDQLHDRLQRAAIAVVGEATRRAVQAWRRDADLVGIAGGQALATALRPRLAPAARVTIFQAEEGTTDWGAAFGGMGVTTRVVPAYRLVTRELTPAEFATVNERAAEIIAIPFTAPSAVERLVQLFSTPTTHFPNARYFAIGSTTAAALVRHALPLAGMPARPALDRLAQLVCKNV